jgi:hypothetical protein
MACFASAIMIAFVLAAIVGSVFRACQIVGMILDDQDQRREDQ